MAIKVFTINYSCNCNDIPHSKKLKFFGIEKEGKIMRKQYGKNTKKSLEHSIEEIRNTWTLIKNDWKIS